MKLRSGRLAALGKAQERDFLGRVARFFRSDYPEQMADYSNDDLVAVCEPLTERALGYGLETERDAFVFLWAANQMGADFDLVYPQARSILASELLSPEAKTEWLVDWVMACLKQAEARRGP